MSVPPTTPLDDFLAGAGSSADTGETLERIGSLGSLIGITLAFGLLVFITVVHRGDRGEVRALVRVVRVAGAVTLVGAAVEVAGTAAIFDEAWSDALTGSNGSAAMMRLFAGALILLGLLDDTVDVDDPVVDGSAPASEPEAPELVRWLPGASSAFGLAGAVAGVLSFGFDGHTVSKGPRVIHALVNVVHVVAGSVWFGGVVGLLVVAVLRRRSDRSTGALVITFSSLATFALIIVVAAGVLMSLIITDGFGDFTGTDWGRTLIVKTGVVVAAAAIGAYHHFVVVPDLEDGADPKPMERRARITFAVEAMLLTGVVVATVFLVGAATT